MDTKKCNKCLEIKPTSEFGKESRALNGFKPRCRLCVNADYNKRYKNFRENKLNQLKKYYQENKKKKLDYQRKYYIDNKEHLLKYRSNYQKINRDKVNNLSRKYHHKNKDTNYFYITSRLIRRIARNVLNKKPGEKVKQLGYSWEQLILVLGRVPNKSESIDHKIPISWFIKGTQINIINSLYNLQILPTLENSIKSDKFSHPISKKYFKQIKPYIKKSKINLIKTI